MSILKRHAEYCSVIGKFGGKRIGVWCIDEGIFIKTSCSRRMNDLPLLAFGAFR